MTGAAVEVARALAIVVRAGLLLALVLVGAGVVLSATASGAGHVVTLAGLFVLLCTPAAELATSALIFWRGGDRRFAALSAFVLFVVLTGALAGGLRG